MKAETFPLSWSSTLNPDAPVFNGTSNVEGLHRNNDVFAHSLHKRDVTNSNGSRLPTWTDVPNDKGTCPSSRPFDPGESYPFDPSIDNSSRSLLDLDAGPC